MNPELYFYTGIPCGNGHDAPRLKRGGACFLCKKEANERHRRANREALAQKQSAFRKANADYYKQYSQSDKQKRACKAWRDANKEYIARKEKENAHRRLEIKARRRAAQLSATPKWLTADHRQQMREMFLRAKQIGELDGKKYEVDHIVPLRSKTVCGLHVPWNLQILERSENRRKWVRYDGGWQTPIFSANDEQKELR